MKRQCLLVFLSVLFIISCFLLTACHTHNFGEWSVAKQPTCTQDGIQVRDCSCGKRDDAMVIPATGHADGDWLLVKQPTCSLQGTQNLICANCDEVLKTESINATGVHNFQDSSICAYCERNIADLAVATYDMSATLADNVTGYVVPYKDGKHEVYIKGSGAMKDYRYETTYDCAIFYKYDSIINIYIQNGVTNIGNCTFIHCENVESVQIPDSVLSIGVNAFSFCRTLSKITIPQSVCSILDGAFMACTNIESITIPQNVSYIGFGAFTGCSNLANIIIEASPSEIGRFAFHDTAFSNNNSNWHNLTLYIGNCLVDAKKSIESCTVKDGTTIIADFTFEQCSQLTTITIPSSITNIGDQAFRYCTALTDIYYQGTQEQWNAITLGNYNECLTNATIHYNYTSEQN